MISLLKTLPSISRQLLNFLPSNEGIVVFDNCWIQPVNKKIDSSQNVIRDLERFLQRSGHTVLKFWFSGEFPIPSTDHPLTTQYQHRTLEELQWQMISSTESEHFSDIFLQQIPYQDLTFSDKSVNFQALRKRAYNLRWATVEEDVIPLTAADPDFPVSIEIEEAIQRYTRERVFSYGPPEGLPEFRETVAYTLQQRKYIPADPGLVLPVDGAASGMFTIARFALQPGDEALVFDPVDFLFQKSVEAAGGKSDPSTFGYKNGNF